MTCQIVEKIEKTIIRSLEFWTRYQNITIRHLIILREMFSQGKAKLENSFSVDNVVLLSNIAHLN